MFIINIAKPLTIFLLLAATILLIILGNIVKKSYVTAIPLFAFLALLVSHVVQLMILPVEYSYLGTTLTWCIVIDLAFIFITFISFLWVDDLDAKKHNKKSIDNSLEWFWKEI